MPTCGGWYAGIHFKSFDAGLKTNRTLIWATWPVNLSGSRWLWTRQATMGINDTHTEKERQLLRSGFNSPKTISPIHCYDSCATELISIGDCEQLSVQLNKASERSPITAACC